MGARTLIAAALVCLLGGCSGPRATATNTHLLPSARAGTYRVETRLINAGGRGQVEVTVRLRNKNTGRIVTQEQSVDVEPGDQTDLAMEVPAPPGDYAVDLRVEYPPR